MTPSQRTSAIARPLAVDLFCGLGGWAEGLMAEGYDVAGFDIEQHEYWAPEEMPDNDDGGKGTRPVAKRGWTQGCAITLGVEGANARPRTRLLKYPGMLCIQDVLTLHGSQFRNAALIIASPPCQEYSYMAMPWSKAKALAADYRSGKRDVKQLTALFDACFRIQREACEAAGHHIPLIVENVRGAIPWVGRSRWNFGSFHLWGDVPALMPPIYRGSARLKTHQGEQWNVNRKNYTGTQGWDSGQKVPGFRFDGSGRAFQTASVNGTKNGNDWFGSGDDCSLQRRAGSGTSARKMASAMIAKIPLPLARHIARSARP